jgi:hypothetical protein
MGTFRVTIALAFLTVAPGLVRARNHLSPIHGVVVDDLVQRPLPDRTVIVGDRRTRTDANGAFTLDGVPAVYDLAVLDADARHVTIYIGLHRRDLRLRHAGRSNEPKPARSATVTAKLTGIPEKDVANFSGVVTFFYLPTKPARSRSASGCQCMDDENDQSNAARRST